MLREELTPIKIYPLFKKIATNLCNNIIYITYYGDDKEKVALQVLKEFKTKFYQTVGDFEENKIWRNLAFWSEWAAPIQFLQSLCNKYNVDIIGVSYEFEGGYVESFELKNQFVEEEVGQYPILFKEFNEELEISELPKSQDEEFLDKEYPIEYDFNGDLLDLTDKQIEDLK